MNVPLSKHTANTITAAAGDIFPAGSGRFRVRSIRASISRSWNWFSAAAPQDNRNTPVTGRKASTGRLPLKMRYPANVEKAMASERKNFTSERILLAIKCFKILDYFIDILRSGSLPL